MAIDTELKGSPGSIESAATWLRDTLGKAVGTAGDKMAGARSTASSDWDGDAGAAFVSRIGTAVGEVDGLGTSISSAADALDAYAGRLRTPQGRMADIRTAAAAAGLTVVGQVIQSPGPGPSNPGLPPTGPISPTAADAYDAQVLAWNAHQAKVEAYNTALADAEQVRADLVTAAQGLDDEYKGVAGADWVLNVASIAGGIAGAAMEFSSSTLRGTARYMTDLSEEYLQRIRANPGAFSNLDLDHWDKVARDADDLARQADDLGRSSKGLPLKLGGGLAVVGIGLDIAEGKDPVQAVASGGGGFLASVAAGASTGAVVGSFVPIPGVGTAAGAIVGAGVGLFTSGAIDSLFENGPDVGEAFDSGLEAVADTAGAIGDGVGAVVDGIGGLFD